MRVEFDPGPQWLHEHDVHSMLVFGNDNAGGETLRLEILPPLMIGWSANRQIRRQLMTLLACCLYLLLIVLVGYALLSVFHPSSRMTMFN